MTRLKRSALWACAVATCSVAAWSESAHATSLQDLIDNSGTFLSQDGTVRFSDFAYVATVNAPDATKISIVPDSSVPQGFLVEPVNPGTDLFHVEDGTSLNALLAFHAGAADTRVGGGPPKAELGLHEWAVSGQLGSLASTVFVSEKVDSLSVPGMVATLTVAASAEETPVLFDETSLVEFGSTVTTLTNISLFAVPPDTGPSTEATLNRFSFNFPNIPEPATGLMLLGLACAFLVRRW